MVHISNVMLSSSSTFTLFPELPHLRLVTTSTHTLWEVYSLQGRLIKGHEGDEYFLPCSPVNYRASTRSCISNDLILRKDTRANFVES